MPDSVSPTGILRNRSSIHITAEQMRAMADDYLVFADRFASGAIKSGLSPERQQSLVSQYRYFASCLNMAAWLVENSAGQVVSRGSDL